MLERKELSLISFFTPDCISIYIKNIVNIKNNKLFQFYEMLHATVQNEISKQLNEMLYNLK
jgi:hypothetical protein